MTPAQIQLARHRLILGITNVGFWVLGSVAGLTWLVIYQPNTLSPILTLAIIASIIATQAVFDFIGGLTLMPEPRPALMPFLHSFARGVLGHSLVLTAVGIVSAISLQQTKGFGLGILFATLALALGRRILLTTIGGAAITELTQGGKKILASTDHDPAATGGIIGIGLRSQSLLPAHWLDNLPKPELATELSRRQWQINHSLHTRALLFILIWNLLGTFVGTQIFALSARPISIALFGHACWMTLWAFASLLVLPVLSRSAVFASDRATADSGHDPRPWIMHFPNLIGEDGNPAPTIQTIFYPIPSATMRLHALEVPNHRFVLGNLARNNLYYSWATLTLLGRAVHCNVGRPSLWVFPPSA